MMLYSAANGATHAECIEWKLSNLAVEAEDIMKRLQAVLSQSVINAVLKVMNIALASRPMLNVLSSAGVMKPHGAHALWRDAQYLEIPTMKAQGVASAFDTPECLDMLSQSLTKELGHDLHDTQVSLQESQVVPMITRNAHTDRFARCVLPGMVQRTHHWAPLLKEVDFAMTERDKKNCIFDTPKDRHLFPWIEVCARFGIIPRKTGPVTK
jgi:hypothetical protein